MKKENSSAEKETKSKEITTFEKQWNHAKKTPFIKLSFLMLIENLRKHQVELTIEHMAELRELTEAIHEMSELDVIL